MNSDNNYLVYFVYYVEPNSFNHETNKIKYNVLFVDLHPSTTVTKW